MIERWRATRASDRDFGLAEGPVWDGPRDRLLWVEIEAGSVHEGRLDGMRVEVTRTLRIDGTVGALAVSRTGEVLVAGTEILHVVAPDGVVTPGPRIVPAGSGRRMNDGKCEPGGDFLVGTMRLDEKPGADEVLVRVGRDRSVTVIDRGLGLSNGLGWSPDGALFYTTDTTPGEVYVRPAGNEGGREIFLRDDWNPDGMCLDAAGNVWIACYDGGEVRRFNPGGELTGVVEVDDAQVTCPEFVGPGLGTLLITTRQHLFTVDPGAAGLPVNMWSGFEG